MQKLQIKRLKIMKPRDRTHYASYYIIVSLPWKMYKFTFGTLAIILIAAATGCQPNNGDNSNPSSSLNDLCDQYATAAKDGDHQEMQRVTPILNNHPKLVNEGPGDQMKWLGDCLERHNVDNL